jgi:hypothetical protein
MRANVRQILGLAILVLGVAMPASGQIYTESVTTGIEEKPQPTQSYFMPKMHKHVQSDGKSVIFRLDKELVIFVDPAKKEYSSMTFQELEQSMQGLQGKMQAALQEMQKQLANLPVEQRRRLEQMIGKELGAGAGDVRYEVKKTGETKTISGYACTKYVVTEGGRDVLVLWVTREVREFAALRRDYEHLAKRLASVAAPFSKWAGMPMEAWAAALKVVDGFPMQQDTSGITTVVTKLERRSIPLGEFEPPPGYRQVAMPALPR